MSFRTNFLSLLLVVTTVFSQFAEARPVRIESESYKLGSRYGGSLSGGGTEVRVECTAIKKEKTDEYLYTFVIKNSGKNYFLFQFDLLNYVLSGRYDFPNVFEMPKGKAYTFTLTSKESPVLVSGNASMFRKDMSIGGRKQLQNDMGVTVSSLDYWILSPGSDFACPLPPSLLKPL